jgi:hypothetical protein
MSCDLTFLRKAADQSWEAALEAAGEAATGELPDSKTGADVLTETRQVLGEVTEHAGDPQVELPVADAAVPPELAVAAFDQVATLFDQREAPNRAPRPQGRGIVAGACPTASPGVF